MRVLYMSNNLFMRLAELPRLPDLVLVENPLEEKHSAEGTWMDKVTKRLPGLRKLDGRADEEEGRAEADQQDEAAGDDRQAGRAGADSTVSVQFKLVEQKL
uniref:Uncharacterized protein n=1 Tax=Haplochromis burtoni TaxID=8153 RepID=A0A3Q2VC23_HAPBU